MIRFIGKVAALALALATGACATPVIVDPTWAELPAPEEMADAYPGFASMIGVHGVAEVQCIGLPDGGVENCVSNWSAPEGLGFDRAALQLTPSFRIAPRTIDGAASKSEVRFRIRFLLPEDEPHEPYAGPAPAADEVALARPLAEKMYAFFEPVMAEGDAADLDVDPDRLAAIERILRDVRTELRADDIEAVALGLARVLTREQIIAMTEGRPPETPPPPFEAFLAASMPDDAAEARRFETRVREKYCALYACDPKGPPRRGR